VLKAIVLHVYPHPGEPLVNLEVFALCTIFIDAHGSDEGFMVQSVFEPI
jgi:hypothetical protein